MCCDDMMVNRTDFGENQSPPSNLQFVWVGGSNVFQADLELHVFQDDMPIFLLPFVSC